METFSLTNLFPSYLIIITLLGSFARFPATWNLDSGVRKGFLNKLEGLKADDKRLKRVINIDERYQTKINVHGGLNWKQAPEILLLCVDVSSYENGEKSNA